MGLDRDVIVAVGPRHGVITRGGDDVPLAANVDAAWIVTALGRDVSARRVERYLALASAAHVDPIVIVNKADLDPSPPLAPALAELRAVAPGVPVLPVSARTGAGVAALEALLGPGRTAVLLGSSGTGKSTLANRLLGTERQATAAVREDDEKGRHTTTWRELIDIPAGGSLIDTPGLRAVPMPADAGAGGAFTDIDALAEDCRFGDCSHAGEPGCAVRAAVDAGELDPQRFASYLTLKAEARRELERTDARARSEKQRAGRTAARALRRLYRDRDRD